MRLGSRFVRLRWFLPGLGIVVGLFATPREAFGQG
jgi:hypothetical protein